MSDSNIDMSWAEDARDRILSPEKIRNLTINRSDGPYWSYTLNIGIGGCKQCVYCYNRHRTWYQKPMRAYRYNLEKFDKHLARFSPIEDAEKCKMGDTDHFIMMTSQGDLFHPVLRATAVRVLSQISFHGNVGDHLRVTTKRLEFDRIGYDGSYLPKNALYGVTLTTLDEAISKKLQPGASVPEELFGQLWFADTMGLDIWVSSEPMLKGANLYEMASYFEPPGCDLPKEWWVGRLNYGGDAQEYALSDEEILRQFQIARDCFPDIDWRIKHDVKGWTEVV